MFLAGVIFFVVPGSMLLVIAGLMLLSVDIPFARKWLVYCQKKMATSAAKLDRWILKKRT